MGIEGVRTKQFCRSCSEIVFKSDYPLSVGTQRVYELDRRLPRDGEHNGQTKEAFDGSQDQVEEGKDGEEKVRQTRSR